MLHDAKPQFLDITVDELKDDDLNLNYEVATLKLRECAQHIPGNDLIKDIEIDALESKLLSIQEGILQKALNFEIKTNDDFNLAKSIWQALVDFKHNRDIFPSDLLAKSIFEYAEIRC